VLAACGGGGGGPSPPLPVTYTIGVDHAAPSADHDWEYVDFFPREGVSVHQGDVLSFAWANAPDGFHNVSLLKTGETVDQAIAAHPLVVPDTDAGDPPSQLQGSPFVFAPTLPPAGSGAPGACGDATTPCSFDGSKDISAGAFPADGKVHFVAKVAAPVGTTLRFTCLVHPGMAGSVKVVSADTTASSPGDVASAADRQASSDTSDALAAESAVTSTTVTNPDGSHTVTLTAGTATKFVEIVEMLPKKVTVKAGDKVTWVTKAIKDIHTVTFPKATKELDPIPLVCEAAAGDTPYTPPEAGGPAGPPCGDPTKLEVHVNLLPQGATVITSGTTVGSSGILSVPPSPLPSSFSFTFPAAGAFDYFCHVHDHMVGTITVT